jgi:thioester reductase-like protein
MSGESDEAFWNPQDFNLLMIKGCVSLCSAPDVHWDIEMTPVNFVSNLIVTLVQNMDLALGKVFHVINTRPIKARY